MQKIPILQSKIYKIQKNAFFLLKNLHISKKSSTFAPSIKIIAQKYI